MNHVPVLTLTLVGVILAAMIGGTAWLLYVGLGARRQADETLALNEQLGALLASSPALAAVVRADGRIDMSDRLAGWFGVMPAPRFLADLSGPDGGLSGEDASALAADVAAAQRSGRPFVRPVRARGSDRSLIVRGQRAAAAMQMPGGVVLWVFDATEGQEEIATLREESQRARAAFDALTGLIEAAPLPMWYRSPDLRLAMVNSAYVAAVEGQDAENVVQHNIELIETGGIDGPLANAVAAREAARPREQTVPATIGGARRMLRVVDVPLPGGGVAGFAIDIDELVQAQGGIRRFAEAQRAMLDRLSAGVAQFGADRALTFCNQPFRRMFAMRSEWLADRPEFDRVLERMREAGRLPEVRDFPGWKRERRDWFTAAGGAVEEHWHLPSGAHLRVVAQALPDGGLLIVFEDRTEQVQLASARDTLLRVRTATFDNLFEALGVFAADGRLQLWNSRFARTWGFPDDFLAQHPRVDALVERAAPRLGNPARAGLIKELVRSATVDRQQRGGRVAFADGRHFEFAAVPLPDGNALFIMLDISDSRRIEQALRDRNEALEAADRVKTAFVANMSYELRTPLTSISGFAEMLHGGYAGRLPKQADTYVAAILESVARLGTLVDEVLDLTRATDVQAPIERHAVDLAQAAADAANAVRALAAERGIDFAIEIDRSVGTVDGDVGRLRQMVEHLLRHAVGGTASGGRVLLHADGTADAARIVVSDDGPGLDGEGVARAFERFRGPGADSGAGLGLALPLARQFAEAHGGTITLLSEPGQGTLVTVTVPRA